MHEKVFSIQIFQYFRQIPPRFCTLVLFITLVFVQQISVGKHLTGVQRDDGRLFIQLLLLLAFHNFQSYISFTV